MRVLYTSPILAYPAAGGPELRVLNSIKALAETSELDIFSRAKASATEHDQNCRFFSGFCQEYQIVPRLVGAGKYACLPVFGEKVLNFCCKTRMIEDADYLLAHVERRRIEVIWFGYGNISYPLIHRIKSFLPDIKVVCDTDSVWSRFILRELPYASGLRKIRIYLSGRRKQTEERAWTNLCNVTTAVSALDADYYRGLTQHQDRIHVFSNVIDLDAYIASTNPPPAFKHPCIYLAGSFGAPSSPMNHAARWMIDYVFPLVLQSHPKTHFYIVGRNSEWEFGKLNNANITVTGYLESVLPYLCNADVAVVPLHYESGTRFKILEAGACNTALVSTTLGAEGIPVRNGEHILIADTPEDFAAAIIRLLNDRNLAKTITQNCHHLVAEHYGIPALAKQAERILDYLNHD